ncbi:MAG: AMP-binding protein [Acidobacteriota bacterium]|nr:AMP-binding protein [Acidobacteriota bacterium]
MYEWLQQAARRRPQQLALEFPDRHGLTYAELLRSVRARASFHGGGAGPRYLEGGDDFAVELHAALLSGTPVIPLDPRLSSEERAQRTVPPDMPYADVATVMFTSGTTSAPKPVYLTLGNWEANAVGSALALGLDLEERWLCTMPLAHVGGLSILLRSTVYATTVVTHERFDTAAVLADLMSAERRITLVSLVPTMLTRLLDAGLASPPTLRWVLLGGGPIPPGLLSRAAAAGVPVAWTYGMTEACSQIATFGLPLHGVTVRLVDGEIQVRGPIVASSALAEDGWLHTGDLGEHDAEGRLRIIGRKSDTIVSGGENVAPAQVEAALLSHPAVADAGVFSRPDAEWGERVVASVVLREGFSVSTAELQDYVGTRLAHFKVPKEISFSDALPRTASGKLLRRKLL